MSASVVTRELLASTMLRMVSVQERAKGMKARLLARVEAGATGPVLSYALAEADAIVRDTEAVLGHLAAFALKCDRRAGCRLPS